MIVTYKITSDLCRRGLAPLLYAVQDDGDSRQVEITLTADGKPWEIPHGATAEICYRKADGTKAAYSQLPGGDAYTISDNIVTVTISNQALDTAGTVQMQVLLKKDAYVLCVSKWQFFVQSVGSEKPDQGRSK